MSQSKVDVHMIFEYRIHTQFGSLCLVNILLSTWDTRSQFSPSSDGMQTSPILFLPFYFSLISTLRDIGDPTPFNENRCFEDEVVQ
jgi:hypothetical protein